MVNGLLNEEIENIRNMMGISTPNTKDEIDTVTMDVPLFIRTLEYAKEDAKTDMDLHDLAEKAISGSKNGVLTMDDYDMLVGNLKQLAEVESKTSTDLTFANLDKGVIVSVNLGDGYEDRLVDWLSNNHESIFSDLDYHEGGSVSVSPEEIVFSGDNGIFILDRINIERI